MSYLNRRRVNSARLNRTDLINWLQHVIDMNEPDLTNGPTDMEIEIPVEIDDQTTWDLIETTMRDRGVCFKVDYTDKTKDNNYYHMYIWKQDNVNSSKSGAKMIKRANKLNSAANIFNEKAFDEYLDSLVEDCVEYANDCGDPVQILVGMYPGYDWRWAAEGTDIDWERARNELRRALYKYLKIQYLAYKDEYEEDL